MKKSVLTLIITLTVFNISCSTSKIMNSVLPQEKYQKEEVLKVKKIAIVSFDILQYAPQGMASKIVGSSLASAQMAVNYKPKNHPLAVEVYEDVRKKLVLNKFEVKKLSDITSNKMYKEIEIAKITQNEKEIPTHYQKPYTVPGIIRSYNPEYLFSKEDLNLLYRDLNVDAVLIMRIKMNISQDSLFGISYGKIYLKPSFTYYLYAKNSDEPIVFVKDKVGDISNEDLGRFSGVEDELKINEVSKSSISNLINKYLKI